MTFAYPPILWALVVVPLICWWRNREAEKLRITSGAYVIWKRASADVLPKRRRSLPLETLLEALLLGMLVAGAAGPRLGGAPPETVVLLDRGRAMRSPVRAAAADGAIARLLDGGPSSVVEVVGHSAEAWRRALAAATGKRRVLVFDRLPDGLSLPADAVAIGIDLPLRNLGISAVAAERRGRELAIHVAIGASSSWTERTTTVVLAIDGREAAREPVAVVPGDETAIAVSIAGPAGEGRRLEARLDPAPADDLAGDDGAVLDLRPVSTAAVEAGLDCFVDALTALGLPVRVFPEGSEAGSADLVVAHEDAEAPAARIIVSPRRGAAEAWLGDAIAAGKAIQAGPQFPPELVLGSARSEVGRGIKAQADLGVWLMVEGVPILGVDRARRRAVFAFDPSEWEFDRQVAFPLIVRELAEVLGAVLPGAASAQAVGKDGGPLDRFETTAAATAGFDKGGLDLAPTERPLGALVAAAALLGLAALAGVRLKKARA